MISTPCIFGGSSVWSRSRRSPPRACIASRSVRRRVLGPRAAFHPLLGPRLPDRGHYELIHTLGSGIEIVLRSLRLKVEAAEADHFKKA